MYLADQVLSNFHVSPIAFDCAAISCVYRPSSTFLGNDKVLFDFINQLTQLYEKNFIFADLIMPNVSWLLDLSQSSQLLVDLLINRHLLQHLLQPTRYRSNQNPSLLDLIISSDDISLSSLDYLISIGISDHITLIVNLQICFMPRKRTVSFKRTAIDFAAVKFFSRNKLEVTTIS